MANTEVGSAYVSIIPSMKGFSKGVAGGVKKSMGAIASAAGVAAKAVAAVGAAAAAGTVAFGKAALDSYAAYEQNVGGVDTLFREASGKLQGYADAAYKTAGISANRYMETATSFAASLVSSCGNDVQRAADMADMAMRDMSDNANKMGTDIDLVNQTYQSLARGNYAMLDNLKLGYGGTKAEMQRLIDTANEYERAQGRAGELTIDSFSDQVQAIHDVQEMLGITGTTALEGASTIEGSLNTLKAAWENWLTELGKSDADMGEATQKVVDALAQAAKNIIPRLKTLSLIHI